MEFHVGHIIQFILFLPFSPPCLLFSSSFSTNSSCLLNKQTNKKPVGMRRVHVCHISNQIYFIWFIPSLLIDKESWQGIFSRKILLIKFSILKQFYTTEVILGRNLNATLRLKCSWAGVGKLFWQNPDKWYFRFCGTYSINCNCMASQYFNSWWFWYSVYCELFLHWFWALNIALGCFNLSYWASEYLFKFCAQSEWVPTCLNIVSAPCSSKAAQDNT